MKGKSKFTQKEADKILELIAQKLQASRGRQKQIWDKIRAIGFYWSDFYSLKRKGGYTQEDFLKVVNIQK